MDRRRLLLRLAVAWLVVAFAAGSHVPLALAKEITCTGQVGAEPDKPTCKGTKQDDGITGSPLRDNVVAGKGDDEVHGGDGMDFLKGEAGSDLIDGGANNDWLEGNQGADHIIGGANSDIVYDDQYKENAPDVLEGNDGDDWVEGAGGDDTVDAGPGDDQLFGWTGEDTLLGGDGSDALKGGQDSDSFDAGPGDDYVDATDDETPGSVDTIVCGDGEDEVLANASDDVAADCEHVTRVPDAAAAPSAKQLRTARADLTAERARFWNRHRGDR